MKNYLLKHLNTLALMPFSIAVLALVQHHLELMQIAAVITAVLWGLGWLLAPVKKRENGTELPAALVKQLRKSLHHSQITFFNEVIEPLMVQYMAPLDLASSSKESVAEFEEKCCLWKEAFIHLKSSGRLYLNRSSVEKDRAITLFVFLAILWGAKQDMSQLKTQLSKLPDFIYKALKKEAYRLYDLPGFILNGNLLCNQDEAELLQKIMPFNQTEAGVISESKPYEENAAPETSRPEPHEDRQISERVLDASAEVPVAAFEVEDNAHQLLQEFLLWLEKRLKSNNRKFDPEAQLLIKTSSNFDKDMVFVESEVLAKYQARSGIVIDELESALNKAFEGDYFYEHSGESVQVFPVKITTALEIKSTSEIYKRSP